MDKFQIKAQVVLTGKTVNQIAAEIKEDRTVVSQTINLSRPNFRVREKLTSTYGINFNTPFRSQTREKKTLEQRRAA